MQNRLFFRFRHENQIQNQKNVGPVIRRRAVVGVVLFVVRNILSLFSSNKSSMKDDVEKKESD